jgi:benzoyl-CoA reductase/2-hydroxyglutaryl-CoA dehydratase subunit BcrC/BadD/HgdB
MQTMNIGLTTTVPVEIILAAGHTAIDLNNIFITAADPLRYIDQAHSDGFPRSLCSWIKGQYAVVTEAKRFDAVIAVTTGDCSNTHAMIELLEDRGIAVYRFAYPTDARSSFAYDELKAQMQRLAATLGTTLEAAQAQMLRMEPLRAKLQELDRLTVAGYVSGAENHIWLVSSSDFNTDIARFERELDSFLALAKTRTPRQSNIRLGYLGVPPIITDIYDFVESKGAGICFNEVQRQFSLPELSLRATRDIVQRYLDYTYPYDIFGRIKDIKAESKARGLHGLIHYVQSFCHRQVQDIMLRKHLDVPILTIEGDSPGTLDERSKIRLESFIEMLEERIA